MGMYLEIYQKYGTTFPLIVLKFSRRKLQLQWNIDYMRLGYCPDKEPEFSTRRSSSVAYPSEEFKELDITILTKDDSLQVRIKPEKLVFDIVSDVLQQIGTNQVFICTYLDISPQRKGMNRRKFI